MYSHELRASNLQTLSKFRKLFSEWFSAELNFLLCFSPGFSADRRLA